MNNQKLRERFIDNNEIIKRLENLLENSNDKQLILDSISKVKEEQKEISKKLKRSVISSLSKKSIQSLMKPEKKEIEEDFEVKEIVYENDNENVVVETVEEIEEETPKVINITEEDVKDRFPKINNTNKIIEESKLPKELKDVKVVFDGTFKVIYDKGKVYEQKVNNPLLDHNINESSAIYNFNIIKLLKDFDEKNNTRLYQRYMVNDIDVLYDFTKTSKQEKSIIKKIKSIAKKESKTFGNITIKKENKLKKFKTGLTAVAAASLLLIGGIGITNRLNKNTTKGVNSTTISQAGETDATEEVKVSIEKISEVTTEEIKQTDVKETESTKKESESKTKEIESTKKETKDEVKTENEKSLKIGDTYNLESTDLYYASTEKDPRGNTSYLSGNYYYKAGIIAVVYKNQVVQLIFDDSINLKELDKVSKEKYGDDVKLFVNFDLVDENDNVVTKHIGWVIQSDVLSKGKVLKR